MVRLVRNTGHSCVILAASCVFVQKAKDSPTENREYGRAVIGSMNGLFIYSLHP